jgi:hypothetical protein
MVSYFSEIVSYFVNYLTKIILIMQKITKDASRFTVFEN